ncbi:DNA-dependent RNA polymerase, partial [Xylella fastidiosa subsp. multiplex]|nr:DNA-dependent RNA polymerase [Xylella fastidiosa subsp. multiplex]
MIGRGLLGGEAWCCWAKETTMHVGIRLIEMLIESTGLVELQRHNAGNAGSDHEALQLAQEYVDVLAKRAGALAGISPMFQPCVVPPKPWVAITGGGYW